MTRLAMLLLWLSVCQGNQLDSVTTPSQPTDPALRQELLDRMERDQELRRLVLKSNSNEQQILELKELDRMHTMWMKSVVEKRRWPTISMVGRDGANAAFLLVQHADHDAAFQRRCLDLMQPLAERSEVSKPDLALLTDRVLLAEGKKQLYGSQFVLDDRGELVPRPIEDEARVDQRREKMGLPPIAEYKKQLIEVYKDASLGKPAQP